MFRSNARTPQLGVILVIAAAACFGGIDTLSKYLSPFVAVVIAMSVRYAIQTLFAAATLLPRRGLSMFRTRHPYLQIMRGLSMAFSSALAYVTLRTVPVGEFSAILAITPLFITVVAARFMSEQVGAARWGLMAVSFAGAMLVIRPGGSDFQWMMLMPLVLVVSTSSFHFMTRYLAREDNPVGMQLITGVVGMLVNCAALPFIDQWPDSTWIWFLLVMLGVLSSFGHYLLILGYECAPPGALAPFIYFHVVFGAIGGWLVFAHVPDGWAVAGMAAIIAAGLAAHRVREHQVRQAEATGA